MVKKKTKKTKNNKNRLIFASVLIGILVLAGAIFFGIKESNQSAWLMVAILSLIVLLGIVFIIVLINRGEKREPDYYTFFIMGIIWIGAGLPLGINTKNWALFVMGIVFMVIGIINRDKWKKRKSFKDMTKTEQWGLIFGLIVLLIAVILGTGFFWFFK